MRKNDSKESKFIANVRKNIHYETFFWLCITKCSNIQAPTGTKKSSDDEIRKCSCKIFCRFNQSKIKRKREWK
jgi:hypothetical protein